MIDLGPEARALLDAARDGDGPTQGDQARVRAAVARRLLLGAAAAGVTGAVARTAPGALGKAALPMSLTAKVVLPAVLATAVGAGMAIHTFDSPRAERQAEVPSSLALRRPPVTPTSSTTRVAPAATTATTEPATTASVRPRAPTKAVTTATIAPAPSVRPAERPASEVGSEVLLIEGAHAALRAGNAERALDLLDEHARRFPSGALGEERDAARVACLCAAGRTADAASARDRFLRAFPDSPQAAGVQSSCGGPHRSPF
jgi:hypothetical protein